MALFFTLFGRNIFLYILKNHICYNSTLAVIFLHITATVLDHLNSASCIFIIIKILLCTYSLRIRFVWVGIEIETFLYLLRELLMELNLSLLHCSSFSSFCVDSLLFLSNRTWTFNYSILSLFKLKVLETTICELSKFIFVIGYGIVRLLRS